MTAQRGGGNVGGIAPTVTIDHRESRCYLDRRYLNRLDMQPPAAALLAAKVVDEAGDAFHVVDARQVDFGVGFVAR